MQKSGWYRAFLLIGMVYWSSFGITVGQFSYRGAPEDFNDSTMKLNDSMVAMSNKIVVKSQTVIDSIPDTPSVFFVIDNSPSMGFSNGTSKLSDSNGYRFQVCNALIDTIYRHYPTAQIGFAAFDSGLDFDATRDTILRKCPSPNNTMGAYLPLLQLNGTYEGITGLALAHKYLHDSLFVIPSGVTHNGSMTRADDLVNNAHRWRGSTNITVGFAAAKNAMLLASHPKQDRYVIFLSDGNANFGVPNTWSFVKGDSVPTTFTVFFTSTTTVPDSLRKMTTNIQANGYSSANPRSNYWPFQVTTYSTLLTFLMNNVYSAIALNSLAGPASISIGTQTATSWVDSAFVFNSLFPLTGASTPFTFNIDYRLTNSGSVLKDTTHIINFNVARVPGQSIDTAKFDVRRWDRSLAFRFNNAVVSSINENMDSVELRFGYSPGTANYSYSSVLVQLYTVAGAHPDSEGYTLTQIGTTDSFSVKFKRATSLFPTRGNGILEHASLNDTIYAVFRNRESPSLPLDTMKIFCPVKASPGKILLSVTDDTIHAGDTANIAGWVATIGGDTISWLRDSIRWNETAPIDPGDGLIGAIGGATRFTSTQAWDSAGNTRNVSIVASVVNPYNTTQIVRATAHIIVLPRTSGLRLHVERNADTALFRHDVVTLRPDFYFRTTEDSLIIMDSATTKLYAYAVVRDTFGNFIRMDSVTTTWTSLNPDTVGAQAQSAKDIVGLGFLTRMNAIHTGSGRVVVAEPGILPDTVVVQLRFDRLLSITFFNAATNLRVDTVSLSTGQTMNLVVEGQWASAPTTWVNISGLWSMTPNPDTLKFATPLPLTAAGGWACNPMTPGHALLIGTSSGLSVTVPMVIVQAGPDSLKLVLITNPDSCYAGRPIKLAGYVGNANGLLTGTTLQSCTYHDFLDNSAREEFLPWLKVNGRSAPDSLDKTLQEAFANGIDTLALVLYYAPRSPDSLHRIQLTLGGILQATTVAFRLKPGIIDSLQIEDTNNVHLVDTLVLTQINPGDSLRARGFDHYGNRIDLDTLAGLVLQNAMWSVDGTLPAQAVVTGADIFYSVPPARATEIGNVWATLVTDSATLRASVPVKVLPSLPLLDSAITRDYKGDGYNSTDGLIDEIDCYFNKAVVIGSGDYVYFSVRNGGDSLKIDSLSRLSDSAYALHIHDVFTNLSTPQTSWRPTVKVTGLPTAVDASVQAADGCAPVIWQVIKHANGPDHHNDVIEVQFSESIRDRTGGKFVTSNQPYQTFTAYYSTGSGYVSIDTMFNNILGFDANQPDSILFFTMRNGANLTDTNYVNIRTPNPLLQDKFGNVPPVDNHRVRVTATGNAIGLTVYPNPTKGTFKHPPQSGNNGDIDLFDQPQAQTWVNDDKAGFVLQLQGVKWPQAGTGYVKAYLQIYDAVGNLVNSAQTDDLLNKSQQGSSKSTDVSIYWNGANHKGMLAAPGIYRAVVYINYPANSLDYKNGRLIKTLGIK